MKAAAFLLAASALVASALAQTSQPPLADKTLVVWKLKREAQKEAQKGSGLLNQCDSPTQQSVWFRALTEDISSESERVFRSGRLRLTIPKTETKLRSLSDEPKRSELLLRLQIPQGKSTQELQYEPLKK